MKRPYEFEGTTRGHVVLADALAGLLAREGLSDAAMLSEIARCWRDVVGPAVCDHVMPWRIDGDELIVAVDDPAWSTEVGFLAGQILSGLAQRLEFPVPTRVKAHVRLGFSVE